MLTDAGLVAMQQADPIFQLGDNLPTRVRDAASATVVRLAVEIADGLPKLGVPRLLGRPAAAAHRAHRRALAPGPLVHWFEQHASRPPHRQRPTPKADSIQRELLVFPTTSPWPRRTAAAAAAVLPRKSIVRLRGPCCRTAQTI